LEPLLYKDIVAMALKEDLGFGDRTTESIFKDEIAKAEIVAKESGVVAGLPVAKEVYAQLDGNVHFKAKLQDGERVQPGDCLVGLNGPIASILKGERVALNFMQRMSGIATAAYLAVEKVSGKGAKIVDTRKTTPGLRLLEKYAVRIGGAGNHRFNLSDMVLIKDNHIVGAGSISKAVARVRQNCGFTVKIEVETASLAEVQEAVDCGVEIIMLDNMTVSQMAEAVFLIGGRTLVEASGGVDPEQLEEAAATGVDLISLGYLTHSSRILDLSLNLLSLQSNPPGQTDNEG
jgi:nicotinate-nucleotide pyrophosphorylase (carboxylating)